MTFIQQTITFRKTKVVKCSLFINLELKEHFQSIGKPTEVHQKEWTLAKI